MRLRLPSILARPVSLITVLALLILPAPPPTHAAPSGYLYLPFAVDGKHGRLYALDSSAANGQFRLAVFAAKDGRRLATYENGGPFALDAAGDRLFVDRGKAGIAVLQGTTGKTLSTIPPPAAGEKQEVLAAPQFDPTSGQLLVFRGPALYGIDITTGKTVRMVNFDLRAQDNCRTPHDVALPISGSRYDAPAQLLYLDFIAYSCIPWIGYTVVSYNTATGVEIARRGSERYVGLAAGGRLYALSWYRFGIGTLWTERAGRVESAVSGWTNGSAFQLDTRRNRLIQSTEGSLRIFDPGDAILRQVVARPVAGDLAGYDPVTDQLYFVQGQTVRAWPAARVGQGEARTTVANPKSPAQPVRLLIPAPAPSKTLFGVWSPPWPDIDCYVFNQTGGMLLMAEGSAGQVTGRGTPWRAGKWRAPETGLPAGCGVSALAVSPNFTADRTLLAGIKGNGIFKSTDGGASWRPASAGLAQMGVRDVALSPGFARDRTAFAVVGDSGLQRSVDGGASWQTAPFQAQPSAAVGATATTPAAQSVLLALSPEFDRDGTLAIHGGKPGASALWFSNDRGEHGHEIPAPGNGDLRLLSLAPAFARWHVLFALDGVGDLYRSGDGGNSWQRVLETGASGATGSGPERSQIVYGPNEEQRPVFLLISGTRNEGEKAVAWGKLYRSADGGQTWAALTAGEEVIPTALALSPTFGADGLLLVGTSDGRVLTLEGAAE